MTDHIKPNSGEVAALPHEEIVRRTEGMISVAYAWHRDFDTTYQTVDHVDIEPVRVGAEGSSHAPTYHHEQHIRATLDASGAFSRASEGDGDEVFDPFALRAQKARWIAAYKEREDVSDEDKARVDGFFAAGLDTLGMQLVWAHHELGMIGLYNPKHNGFTPFKKHVRWCHEERSTAIASSEIDKELPSEIFEYNSILKAFVVDLMKATEFIPGSTSGVSDKPYRQFMQVVDQCLSVPFSQGSAEEGVAGLRNEWYVSEESFDFREEESMRFFVERLLALVPDPQARAQMLRLTAGSVGGMMGFSRADYESLLPDEGERELVGRTAEEALGRAPKVTIGRASRARPTTEPMSVDAIERVVRVGAMYQTLDTMDSTREAQILMHDLQNAFAAALLLADGDYEALSGTPDAPMELENFRHLLQGTFNTELINTLPTALDKLINAFDRAAADLDIQDLAGHYPKTYGQLLELRRFANYMLQTAEFLRTFEPAHLYELAESQEDLAHVVRTFGGTFDSDEHHDITMSLFPTLKNMLRNAQRHALLSDGGRVAPAIADGVVVRVSMETSGAISVENNSFTLLPPTPLALGVRGEYGQTGLGLYIADFFATLSGYRIEHSCEERFTDSGDTYYRVKFSLVPVEAPSD